MNKIFKENTTVGLLDYEQKIAYFSKHHNNKVRSELAESFKNFDEEFSEKILCDLLNDKNWIVRNDAAESLETIGTIKYAVPSLYKQIQKEKSYLNISRMLINLTTIIRADYIEEKRTLIYFSLEMKNKYYKVAMIKSSVLLCLIYLDKSDYYEELLHIYASKNLEDKYHVVIHLRLLVNYNLMYRDNTFNQIILNDVSKLIVLNDKHYFLIKDTIQNIIKIISTN